jgi:hypothetical protein
LVRLAKGVHGDDLVPRYAAAASRPAWRQQRAALSNGLADELVQLLRAQSVVAITVIDTPRGPTLPGCAM